MATTHSLGGDVKDLALAEHGKRKIEWANQQMPVLQLDPQAVHQGAAAQGRARFGLPARHQRDRQPGDHAARRRRRRRAVRLESALHAGRSGRLPGEGLQHSDLRHQGRGQRHLLLAPQRRARSQAADHHGRRRGPGDHAAHQAHRSGARRSSAAPRRPPPASSACAPWPRTARSSIRSSP